MRDPEMLRRWHAGQTGLHPVNPAGEPWDSRSAAAMQKQSCSGCDRQINPKYTLCASCTEDMGYARRAR